VSAGSRCFSSRLVGCFGREAPEGASFALWSEFVSGSKNSYHSYELNLVLNDGSRINVVDHGNLERLRSDASTLSRFLDKPVWDATRG
jgi:hypothetical protein